MSDSYESEVVRQESSAGEPVRPVVPATTGVTTSRTAVYRQGTGYYRVVQVIWWIVGLIDTLIAIRFLLRLFGANPAPFVRFIYDITWPLVAPFHGIFNTTQVDRAVFEPEDIIAALIYLLIGWGIVSLIRITSRPSARTTVVE